MAIRIRSRFHRDGRERTVAELSGVVAMLAWKLAIESLKRMRRADYDIATGRPWFEFVAEFMVFLATAADRVAHRELEAAARAEFTTELAVRMAGFLEDNAAMLIGQASPGACRQDFLERFNRRGADYAGFGYDESGPDFGFRRYFASCLRDVLPEQDQLWVIDQAMEIEAPDALKALEKTLAGLFHPASSPELDQHVTVIG